MVEHTLLFVILRWTDNSNNEQSFVISYANTSGGPYTDILVATSDLSGSGDTETYNHTGLTCDAPYYYVIKARNGFKNDSANTSEINFTLSCTSPSAINLTPSVTSFNEGETLSLDGSFTDPDSNESRNITIDWGDSSNNTTFTYCCLGN